MAGRLSLTVAWLALALGGSAVAQELDPSLIDPFQQATPTTPPPQAAPAPPPAAPPAAPSTAAVAPQQVTTPQGYIRVEPGQPAEDAPPAPEYDEDEVPGSEGYDGQVAPDAAQDVDFQTFHDALSPYGHWVYTADYGWIWQPDGEAADWVPYSDGQWQWSAYGWTWCGAEPWAWAPYHYGRWVSMNGLGWGWVPGYTWGPAWVSWRSGPGYVGWTPLWPGRSYGRWGGWPINYSHWSFTPLNHFYGGRVGGFLVRGTAVSGIWGLTSFASSFHYNNATFMGPHPSLVASAIGHAVTPVAIHPLTSVSQAHLAGLSGRTLNVLAPVFQGVAHPFVENGRIGNVAPSAVLGNRLSQASAAQPGGTMPFRGALPNNPATRSFASRGEESPGTFSTYHAPSISNGYGSYGAYRGPVGNGYGSSYRTPSYSGGSYRGGYSGGYRGPSYGAPHYGGGYAGGYRAAPSYGGSSFHSSSRPSFHGGGGGGGGGGGRAGGGRR